MPRPPALKQAWLWGRGIKKTAQLRCFSFCCFAERKGFEPLVPFWSTHAFQACAFDHSATSPERLPLRVWSSGGENTIFFDFSACQRKLLFYFVMNAGAGMLWPEMGLRFLWLLGYQVRGALGMTGYEVGSWKRRRALAVVMRAISSGVVWRSSATFWAMRGR